MSIWSEVNKEFTEKIFLKVFSVSDFKVDLTGGSKPERKTYPFTWSAILFLCIVNFEIYDKKSWSTERHAFRWNIKVECVFPMPKLDIIAIGKTHPLWVFDMQSRNRIGKSGQITHILFPIFPNMTSRDKFWMNILFNFMNAIQYWLYVLYWSYCIFYL